MKMCKRKFTLIELLIVISVLIILMTMSLGVWSIVSRKNKDAKTQSIISMLKIGLENYRATYGYYPQTRGNSQPFHLDLHDPGAAKTLNGKPNPLHNDNNFNHYIEYSYLTNSAQSRKINDIYYVLDGYGNFIYYSCPGKFNYANFDLQSYGANGIDDSGDDDGDDVTNYTKN